MEETYAFALDCGAAVVEYLRSCIHELQRTLHVWCGISLRTVKMSLVTTTAVLAVVLLMLLVTLGCVVVSLFGAIAVRAYILSHAPVSQLFRLDVNTMPLETELWRLQRLDALTSTVLSQVEPTSQRMDDAVPVRRTDHAETQLRSLLVEQAASLKMSIVTRHVQSMIATSTLIIPSLVQKEVFPPGGGVSMEALFRQEGPMFNAPGVYDAKVQFVFLKEDVGRDVSMVLESSMLMAEDPLVSQAISSLDVLLKTTTSFTITTGEKVTNWPKMLVVTLMHLAFGFPLWLHDKLDLAIRQDVFPGVDQAREVAVVATVYSGFEPPVDLQPRLRAINFTLYQETADVSSKLRLMQMYFYSGVQLTGLPYYFTTYAMGSLVTTGLILFMFCGLALAGGTVLAAGTTLFSSLGRSAHGKVDSGVRALDDGSSSSSSNDDDEVEYVEGAEREAPTGSGRLDVVFNTPQLSPRSVDGNEMLLPSSSTHL